MNDTLQILQGILGLPQLSPEVFVGVFTAVMGATRWIVQPLKMAIEKKWGEQEGLAAGLALVLTFVLLPTLTWAFKTNLDGDTFLALLVAGIGAQSLGNSVANRMSKTTDSQKRIEAGIIQPPTNGGQ